MKESHYSNKPESPYEIFKGIDTYSITIQIFDKFDDETHTNCTVKFNEFRVKIKTVEQGLFNLEDVKASPEKYLFYRSYDDPDLTIMTNTVQEWIDSVVKHDKDYDDTISCIVYGLCETHTGDPVTNAYLEKFKTEAIKCATWKGKVWAKCYQILSDVNFNIRPVPTKEQLIKELPTIEW